MTESERNCPLCDAAEPQPFFRDSRGYDRCENCDLVFVHAADFLELRAERRHYDLHENSPEDLRYRKFLSRLCDPMCARIKPGSLGLDFGSGPGPTLSVMFAERGHEMRIFDPYYAPDRTVFSESFDFISATEVLEHLHQPAQELERLWNMLRPGGWLGVMTKRVHEAADFSLWHYKNDPTHVCFFSKATFEWLAGKWNAHLEFPGNDTVLLQKPNGGDFR